MLISRVESFYVIFCWWNWVTTFRSKWGCSVNGDLATFVIPVATTVHKAVPVFPCTSTGINIQKSSLWDYNTCYPVFFLTVFICLYSMSAYVYNVYEYCNTVYMQLILAILVCKKQQLALIYTIQYFKKENFGGFCCIQYMTCII